MTTITTRSGKGSPLTNDEVDANFTGLNSDKVETSGDSMTGNLSFGDNNKAIFGAGSDLTIFSDGGTFSYINNTQGILRIRNTSDDQDVAIQSDNGSGGVTDYFLADGSSGAVKLYNYGTQKLATTSTGIDVTGVITTDGMTTSADINFGDNDKAVFGAGSDLQIYHDGSHSYVSDQGTGRLVLNSSGGGVRIEKSPTENMAIFTPDGNCELFYDNSLKLATTSTGIDVTGSVVSDGLTLDNNGSVIFNAPQATDTVLIGTNDNDLVLRTDDGDIILKTNENKQQLKVSNNGDISFYEDTGTTAKLVWKSADERLGIGTSSPTRQLSIYGTNDGYMSFNGGRVGNHEFVVGTDSVGFVIYDETLDTYRLVIDQDSGNVGIGTSSPSQMLELSANNGLSGVANVLRFNDSDVGVTAAQPTGRIEFAENDGGNTTVSAFLEVETVGTSGGGEMTFGTGAAGVTATERMRIDSSGNVGIGTDSPIAGSGYANLTLNGNTGGQLHFTDNDVKKATIASATDDLYVQSVSQTIFRNGGFTSGDEAMRIDSSGNLLVGNTAYNTADGNILQGNGEVFSTIANSLNTLHVYDITNSAFRFYVSGGGQIHATNTSITAISDQSLKENIRDLDKGLESVLALQPRRFDWKNGDGNDIMGFVAQEVEEVMPELIHEYKYNDEETKLGLKMGDMIPSLVKAIQEQNEIINDLRARVAQLEGEA